MPSKPPGAEYLPRHNSSIQEYPEYLRKISSYRFANGMALTLSSGLTPEECLNLAADLIEQDEFRRRLSKCKEAVSSGEDLCNTLLENGVFFREYMQEWHLLDQGPAY